MSKEKKRREKEERRNSDLMNLTLPFGINPLQLMSMLGSNIDMSQIGNMLFINENGWSRLNNFAAYKF